jgi:hypothetical protein
MRGSIAFRRGLHAVDQVADGVAFDARPCVVTKGGWDFEEGSAYNN